MASRRLSLDLLKHPLATENIKSSEEASETFTEFFYRFANKSTIPGLSKVGQSESHNCERFLWFFLLLLAFLGTVHVCLQLSHRFYAGNMETVINSTQYPVYHISFPVVSICNRNQLNWQRLEAAKRKFLPQENNTEILQLFEMIISAYDTFRFGKFHVFQILEYQPIQSLNHINFSLVYEYMSWTCQELLTDCKWRNNDINCCDNFFKRRSEIGFCWSFNTLETEEGKLRQLNDPKWPLRTGNSGMKSGLMLRALINPESIYPGSPKAEGIKVLITEPHVWHSEPLLVPVNTNAIIEVNPVIFFYENDTKSLTSQQRKCVFSDETSSQAFKTLPGEVYMIENCISQCKQEYLLKYCNCTVDIFFPTGNYPICDLEGLLCLSHYYEYFLYIYEPEEVQYVADDYDKSMLCKCFRNCYSLNFLKEMRTTFLPADIRGNKSYIDLDVHFRFDTMMVYSTHLVVGWMDLISAFGGIAGLFMGCSLISVMEVLYFLLFEFPLFLGYQLKKLMILSTVPIARARSFYNKNEMQKFVKEEANLVTTSNKITSEESKFLTQGVPKFLEKEDVITNTLKYSEDTMLKRPRYEENESVASILYDGKDTITEASKNETDRESTLTTPENDKETTLISPFEETTTTSPSAENDGKTTSTSSTFTSTTEPTPPRTTIDEHENSSNPNEAVAKYFNKKIEETHKLYGRFPEQTSYDREVNSFLKDLQKIPENNATEEDFNRVESVFRQFLIYRIQRELLEAEAIEAREYLRNLTDNDAVDNKIKLQASKHEVSLLEKEQGTIKDLEKALQDYEIFVYNLPPPVPPVTPPVSEASSIFTFDQILQLLGALGESLSIVF
uniref:Sodium channel protein Nach n=1 Tax=Glossina brevipalpis TaxID=37001 RepID=A0A1A9X093_9MUSC